ncbi:hypothetical protein EHS13_02205 [Paenibacillus psychroresistens]|uniref:Uncharacterized protein n=1 Tax=Paenibacillus psychroresistens TaxID=1778678 RepID=A0A6B8RC62_9BACL|nr:hypothetical protein [Paenibacillus psychroresistens]QGQ93800.1 hypothetical protein EHS13_02205 [Paenibacillus psychroresistens]
MNLINSKPIEITDATLSGVMKTDGIIEWYINIDCGIFEISGHSNAPRIYLERFEWEIDSIEEIVNRAINIEDGSSLSNNIILPGERLCCLYVSEHQFRRK